MRTGFALRSTTYSSRRVLCDSRFGDGTLRVSTFHAFGLLWLLPRLPQFRAAHLHPPIDGPPAGCLGRQNLARATIAVACQMLLRWWRLLDSSRRQVFEEGRH